MHSRIFQASETPLGDETLTEDDLADYEGYINYDYVQEMTDNGVLDSYEWAFGRPAFTLARDEHGPYAELRDKAEYFGTKYERFKEAAEEAASATFEEFCTDDHFTGLEMHVYEIKSNYVDKLAFWLVGIEYFGAPVPLDEWVRHAKVGDRLYLGAVFDYHFRARLGKPLRGAPPPISGYRYLSGYRRPLPPSPSRSPFGFTKNQRKGLYTTTVMWCSVIQ